jgi:transcriptional regulator with XRE-family HTH domain
MSKEKEKYSEFAGALRRLLYDTKLYSIKEWCELLGITPSAISQWLHDETMPRPELLRMIVGEAKRSSGVPPEVLEEFELMASKPANQVLPLGRRMEGSINSYLVSPLLSGFMRDLQRLRPTEQEKVLLQASEECAIVSGIIQRPNVSLENRVNANTFANGQAIPDHALEAAEGVLASLGERANVLFDQISKYLAGSTDESLRPKARTFCLHALAHVRIQNDNAAKRVMQHIMRSMDEIRTFPHLQRMNEALNVLFLADEETAILVRGKDGEFRSIEEGIDCEDDIEGHMRVINSLDVQYVPAERGESYKPFRFNKDVTLSA